MHLLAEQAGERVGEAAAAAALTRLASRVVHRLVVLLESNLRLAAADRAEEGLDALLAKVVALGAKQLAEAVLACNQLETFSRIPLKELRCEAVKKLTIYKKGLGDVEATVMANLLESEKCVLETLALEANHICTDGGIAIAQALKSNKSLTKLNLANNRLCGTWMDKFQKRGRYTPDAMHAMAEALRISSSLKSCDLRHNGYVNLSSNSQATNSHRATFKARWSTLRDAIKDKEGFELLVWDGK